jgi:hypothetical protein
MTSFEAVKGLVGKEMVEIGVIFDLNVSGMSAREISTALNEYAKLGKDWTPEKVLNAIEKRKGSYDRQTA